MVIQPSPMSVPVPLDDEYHSRVFLRAIEFVVGVLDPGDQDSAGVEPSRVRHGPILVQGEFR